MSGSKFKLFTNGVPNMNFDKYDSHSYSQNSFSFIGIPYTNKIWLVMTPLLGLYYYTHILLTIVGHEFQHVVLQVQQDSSICECQPSFLMLACEEHVKVPFKGQPSNYIKCNPLYISLPQRNWYCSTLKDLAFNFRSLMPILFAS